MAFKREADSHEWLTLLKKRRIAELFSEDIPDDEAVLMKNGRFCCTVCYHRPIFDTAQMLAHHRSGKKHSAAQEEHTDKKLEMEQLSLKHKHNQYVQGKEVSASTSTSAVKGAQHPLLTAQKYEPTVKKKVKPGQRRPVMDLEGAQTISDYKRLKFQSKSETIAVKPYRHKDIKYGEQINFSTKVTNASYVHSNGSGTINIIKNEKKPCVSQAVQCDKSVVYVHPQNNRIKMKHKPKISEKVHSAKDEKKQKTAELYLQARGSGWKRALDGSWIRDEDAEFDSDDEPPDIP